MVLNQTATAFLIVNATSLFLLPRRWALLPILVTACYMTAAQGIVLGPFHFSVIRLMVLAGILRVVLRGERLNQPPNALDGLIVLWAGWLLTSSLFHDDVSTALLYRLGLAFDVCGIYLLVRVFCQSMEDLVQLFKITAIVLVPVSVEMLYEKLHAYNIFSTFGGVDEIPYTRGGNVRAQGPFAHAILAGTVGAVCLPMTFSLWTVHRKLALMGTAACLAMVYASTSSGPIISVLAAVLALVMWKFRDRARLICWLAVLVYITLDLVMEDPAYFIMARIDLAGGSTGWYRARLIQSSIEHLSEWWAVGTDYTRHWMTHGLLSSPNHVDITNHYLKFGVLGGLPLVLLFIAQLRRGFLFVGQTVAQWIDCPVRVKFAFSVWCLGAALFVHAVTCISISYFDQTGVFLYMTLGAISATQSKTFVYGRTRWKRRTAKRKADRIENNFDRNEVAGEGLRLSRDVNRL